MRAKWRTEIHIRGMVSFLVRWRNKETFFCLVPCSWQDEKHLSSFLYGAQKLPSLLFPSANITLSTLLILAVCRKRVIWTTAKKHAFTVNFPKWWMTEKFNIKLTFSDIWKRAANSQLTLSKTQEKHEVHRKLSSTRKIPMNSLFTWTFFYSFPVRANAAFSKRFPTE